jgi:hypothetical protein
LADLHWFVASQLDTTNDAEHEHYMEMPMVDSWYWRLATVPRLLYIWRLGKWLGRKQHDLEVNANLVKGCKFLLVLFMSIHWMGCFCFAVSLWANLDETTWPAYISESGARACRTQWYLKT